jgi:hypothetical protein
MLFALLVIPESPKWFYGRDRFHEARVTLNFIAEKNKVPFRFDNVIFDKEESIVSNGEAGINADDKPIARKVTMSKRTETLGSLEIPLDRIKLEGKISELFTHWQLRRNLIVQTF